MRETEESMGGEAVGGKEETEGGGEEAEGRGKEETEGGGREAERDSGMEKDWVRF